MTTRSGPAAVLGLDDESLGACDSASPQKTLSDALRALAPWIAAALLGVVLASWTETIRPSHHALALPVLVHAFGWRHTRWRIHAATLQLSSCRHEMKWALMELDRCERLAALGVPAPLDEARANITRIQTTQEETGASLQAMGYRATLRRR